MLKNQADTQDKISQLKDCVTSSFLSQVSAQLLRLILNLILAGWTARYLGPTSLGKLSYVIAIVAFLSPLGSLGSGESLRALISNPGDLCALVSTSFCIQIIGTILISILAIPVGVIADDRVIVGLLTMYIIANLFNSFEVFEIYLLSRYRGTLVAKTSVVQTLLTALMTIGALSLRAPLIFFGIIQLAQSCIRGILLLYYSGNHGLNLLLQSPSLVTAKVLLKRGLPLVLSGLAISIYMKSDQLMLQWIGGFGDVGQYSVAVRVAESFYFIPSLLSQTLFPHFSSIYLGIPSSFTLRTLHFAFWITGISLFIASLTIAPWLLINIFGSEYYPAKVSLIALAPSALAISLGAASNIWLNIKNLSRIIALSTLIGALLNIILNALLIPPLGILGAAIATSISQFATLFSTLFLSSYSNAGHEISSLIFMR